MVGPWAFPPAEANDMPLAESLERIDVMGTVLSLSVLRDAPHGWGTGYVIALLCVGSTLPICFVWWESKSQFPLMPLAIWKDSTFSAVIAAQCLGDVGFSSTTFWLSLLLQNVRKDSAIKIALELLPMVIGGIAVDVVCAFIHHKVSNQVLMGVGTVAYMAAFLILSLLREEAPYWAFIFPSLILMVIGVDVQYNVTNVNVRDELASGTAVGCGWDIQYYYQAMWESITGDFNFDIHFYQGKDGGDSHRCSPLSLHLSVRSGGDWNIALSYFIREDWEAEVVPQSRKFQMSKDNITIHP
ncbi:hypothetical protein BDV34DRAFT_230515 [Aspergillus parasiticus]|uniref:Uncharacterized protein n=1 Tax=Aspergillus parasiticus TaxID=5067 RepID=A0A5N6D5A2_ASPPA|nr:hypothetical protein BDV34DRAFT_230515 [Aspergillus parasiticus]